ncbi:MAG: hypothetical protein ACTSP4_17135, partial [Candidatus Hodarchaeales archaeon]
IMELTELMIPMRGGPMSHPHQPQFRKEMKLERDIPSGREVEMFPGRGFPLFIQDSPVFKIGKILLDGIDLSVVDIDKLIDDQETSVFLIQALLGPAAGMFSGNRLNPFYIKKVISLADTEDKKALITKLIRKHLEKMQDSINNALDLLENI